MVDQKTSRAALRSIYDQAEYGLIAARATRRQAEEYAFHVGYSDESFRVLQSASDSEKRASLILEQARSAAESAGVIVSTHTALMHL